MKIAAVSEDGTTISQHFGRAPFYIVLTLQDGRIISREQRDKLGHAHFAGGEHHEHGSHSPDHGSGTRGHGFDPASQGRHAQMVTAIADCQALLARGMGAGAYQSIEQAGIRPVITDIEKIEDAVEAYAAGRIVDHTERLH